MKNKKNNLVKVKKPLFLFENMRNEENPKYKDFLIKKVLNLVSGDPKYKEIKKSLPYYDISELEELIKIREDILFISGFNQLEVIEVYNRGF